MSKLFERDFARQSAAIFCCLVAFAAHQPDKVKAEIVVSGSSVSDYQRGAILDDRTIFDVPKGGSLKLVKRPGGSTHDIRGPYKGTLDAYRPPRACPWYKPWCKRGTANSSVGGTRGLTIKN
ncbi:MAG: hypothetical protein ACR2PG_25855 [Hyphomicrobiaceae bacterium]